MAISGVDQCHFAYGEERASQLLKIFSLIKFYGVKYYQI